MKRARKQGVKTNVSQSYFVGEQLADVVAEEDADDDDDDDADDVGESNEWVECSEEWEGELVDAGGNGTDG